MENLFVYGTLKESKIQKKIIGREVKGDDDILEGYVMSKIIIEGEEYPILIEGEGKMGGKLISVSSDELKKTDEYETSAYARKRVRLKSGKEGWVYVGNGNNERLTRAFIAIDFPDEVVKEVARVQEILEKKKFTGKLTELENLHLTLKFLGEIDSEKLEEVRKRLGEIKFEEMDLKLGEVGVFGLRGEPRIVWIKVEGKGIWALQKKVDEALKDLFKSEERFMSHLTIARIKYVKDKQGFVDYVQGMKARKIEFKLNKFSLKSSELKRLGPVYKDIEDYRADR